MFRNTLALFTSVCFLGSVAAADPKPGCPYQTAHAAPLKASEDVVKEADSFKQYRVEFDGIKGDRVPAFFYVPKNAKGKCPTVLLQYGSGGDKKTDYIVSIGK